MTAFTSILSRTEAPTRYEAMRAMLNNLRDLEAAYPECNRTFRRDVVRDMICQFLACDLSINALDALLDAANETDPQEREAAAERAVEWAGKLHRSLEAEAAAHNLGGW
jgi:hypothetical protein